MSSSLVSADQFGKEGTNGLTLTSIEQRLMVVPVYTHCSPDLEARAISMATPEISTKGLPRLSSHASP